jgi:hypothetical protein
MTLQPSLKQQARAQTHYKVQGGDKMKQIGNSVLNQKSSGVSPPKKQNSNHAEKLEQKQKKRTKENTEEDIKYGMPSNEGDATSKDLAKQTQEIVREKRAFDAKQDIPLDDIESE